MASGSPDRDFEELVADTFGGEIHPGSGAGRWIKMDANGASVVWSCKWTKHNSFSYNRHDMMAVDRAVRGPGGFGSDVLPGMAFGTGDGFWVCMMQPADMLEFVQRTPPRIDMKRGEARRHESSMTPLERRLAEEAP